MRFSKNDQPRERSVSHLEQKDHETLFFGQKEIELDYFWGEKGITRTIWLEKNGEKIAIFVSWYFYRKVYSKEEVY